MLHGICAETASYSSAKDSQSGKRTTTATKSSGRRDGKEKEIVFSASGLATYVAGPFLLKKRNQCL